MTRTYRAVQFSEYGEPDVLRTVELDVPPPGPGQVRVSVRAAGVNPMDWKLRSGAMAQFMPVDLPAVPGGEVAGVVDAVGPGVTGHAVGDEVLGSIGTGGYAALALAPAEMLVRKPASIPWETAAALPVAGSTSLYLLELLGLSRGDTLLVDGAAGGVGTFAVQAARHQGLNVIGTASARNHDYLRSLGVVPVAYGEKLAERVREVAPDGIAGALDLAGAGSLAELLDLTGSADRVLTIADASAAESGVRFVAAPAEEISRLLGAAAELVADGHVTLTVSHAYPLAEAADAHRESQTGHARGKLVVLPG
ncbi:Quinone oxidoreductase 1 [Actinomadura rubteroloni]|uniref:Quinone oxidoreductase 1 n=1 Tax=Actinomadura rubteroloni TaxID=1926885 RepID=A0A2P4UCR4_9ACTN|nr:NADP-dependent oxidoreductase [Actinomadura rubteroloni]POM22839.1 Quinone oxidoreductase 1 [Actinomadura rubteroloni]